jgi:hypothetical protein
MALTPIGSSGLVEQSYSSSIGQGYREYADGGRPEPETPNEAPRNNNFPSPSCGLFNNNGAIKEREFGEGACGGQADQDACGANATGSGTCGAANSDGCNARADEKSCGARSYENSACGSDAGGRIQGTPYLIIDNFDRICLDF